MSNTDVLKMALQNLMRRKLRTFLTVLSVVIGATAIIVMSSIGLGISMSFDSQIAQMDNVTRIEISNWSGYQSQTKDAVILDDEKIKEISQINGVEAVTPSIDLYMYAMSGRYVASFQVMGMDLSVIDKFGYKLLDGRLPDSSEPYGVVFGSEIPAQFLSQQEQGRRNWRGLVSQQEKKINVDVLKDKIKFSPDYSFIEPKQTSGGSEELYPDEGGAYDETTQQTVEPFKAFNVQGVGIMDGSVGYEGAQYCFMDVATVNKINEEYMKWLQKSQQGRTQTKTNGYPRALVKCKSLDDVEAVAAELAKYNFEYIYNPVEFVQPMRRFMGMLQIALTGIGGISVIIAAIGIANTLIMSIYERTKEIGVMKVIGASLGDIKKLFLAEAAMIGLLGGILGVSLSFLVSYLMNNLQISALSGMFGGSGGGGMKLSVIPPWLVLLSLAISSLVGLLAGYFPARRATKLSALNALRYE
ncbi:MAG: ABC transporter permease [Clostridiales bacterium]|jgi:ABC-type antimicrobial peptide transport system permease subunit|nr:ABC transporter permease [Clostridiales bacterium]